MNAFLTAYLGGTHGTAKSARDFLRAMLAYKERVIVISPEKERENYFFYIRVRDTIW